MGLRLPLGLVAADPGGFCCVSTPSRPYGHRSALDQGARERGRSGYLGELDYHHVPLFEQEALPFRPFEVGRPDPVQGEVYLSIAVACGDSVARCLRTIAECDHAVVFHCAAGRDRTGIVAA